MTAFANLRMTFQDTAWLDDGFFTNLDIRTDIGVMSIQDPYTVE